MADADRNKSAPLQDAAINLLCDLIRKPSVTPRDAGCQDLLFTRLSAAGFNVEPMPFGDVNNFWARRGTSSPVLCFAGHTDVVPPGELCHWETDPFEPVMVNGSLHGRGAADMKGGLAAMVVAVENFIAEHPEHKGSIAFLITSDEEGPAIDGTKKVIQSLVARNEQIDFCVIGEPSSSVRLGDVVRIGRRGSLSGKLTVKGVQGHVAYPQHADNPIQRFAPVLAALHDTVWDEGNEQFPPTSFQMVNLQAGIGAANVTPPTLQAEFNFRYSTEWSYQALQDQFIAILEPFELDYDLEWILSGEPFLTGPGKLIDAVITAVTEKTGSSPELSTGGGTSDGRFIAPTGAQVVELGLINTTVHQANECVDASDVSRLSDIYGRILELVLSG